MLVIKLPYGGCGNLSGYEGSVLFNTITRKLITSGIKKVISNGTKSIIAHKVADAVVKGSTTATQKAAENTVTGIVDSVKPLLKAGIKKVINKKRKTTSPKGEVEEKKQEIPVHINTH